MTLVDGANWGDWTRFHRTGLLSFAKNEDKLGEAEESMGLAEVGVYVILTDARSMAETENCGGLDGPKFSLLDLSRATSKCVISFRHTRVI